jgi:hypothetical protein
MTQRVQTVKKLKESLESYLMLSGMYEQARSTYYLWIRAASNSSITVSNIELTAANKEVLAGFEAIFMHGVLHNSRSSLNLTAKHLHNLTYLKFMQEAEDHIKNLFKYAYSVEELINFDIAEFIFAKVLDSKAPILAAYTVLHLMCANPVYSKTVKSLRKRQLYYIERKKRNHES